MKLQYLIDQIEPEIVACADYPVFVLEDISENKEASEFQEYDVLDIEIEEKDPEINLITNQNGNKEGKGLTLSALFSSLNSLLPQHREYSLFSGSAKQYVDKTHWVRLDVPLIALGWDHKGRHFGLVQQKSKKK